MTQDRIEDLEHSLAQRQDDCVRVREALVPLLEGVYPYSEDIQGDTDTLRAGFVAHTAADRIRDQEVEIERLTGLLTAANSEIGRRADKYVDLLAVRSGLEEKVALLQADVSFRSGVTLGLQYENERLQFRNDQLTSDMETRDETNQSWIDYKHRTEIERERLRIQLTEALGEKPDERGRPLHIEQIVEAVTRKTKRVALLEKTTEVRKAMLGRAAERSSELATEVNELRVRELRAPVEWEKEFKIEVRDPDGWRFDRRGENGWKAQEWDVPMTRDEFRQRAAASTVRPLVGSNWGRA